MYLNPINYNANKHALSDGLTCMLAHSYLFWAHFISICLGILRLVFVKVVKNEGKTTEKIHSTCTISGV